MTKEVSKYIYRTLYANMQPTRSRLLLTDGYCRYYSGSKMQYCMFYFCKVQNRPQLASQTHTTGTITGL